MLNNYERVKKNDYILQNAANSAVGNYIIQLCKYYESVDEEKRKLLIADEKISTTTGKLRKIGKVASTSIYNYIYCYK